MANKKMGRPTDRKKDSILKIRLSKNDLIIIDDFANLYGLDRSTFVRFVLYLFIDTHTSFLYGHEDISDSRLFDLIISIKNNENPFDGLDDLHLCLDTDDEYQEFRNISSLVRKENK